MTKSEAGMAVPDEEVLDRVRGGDVASFELLMRRHNQRLFRVCRAILHSDPEAEDATQQAWLDAFAHLKSFEGRSSVATWLTKIALHGSLARARKSGREVQLEDEDRMPDEKQLTPEDGAAGSEMRVILETAIDALPDTLRVAFMLRDVEGLSTSEAAQTLGIEEDALKTRLVRARRSLRDRIEQHIDRSASQAFRFDGARCDRIVANVLAKITASS